MSEKMFDSAARGAAAAAAQENLIRTQNMCEHRRTSEG